MSKNSHIQRPFLACEIAADGVVAARAAETDRTFEMLVGRELGEGVVAPDLTEHNVLQPEALARTIGEVLNGAGSKSKDVIAVLPDAACRVVLLDFDQLPAKPDEADGVVRFRLKKSLPFDVERARVSYQSLPVEGGVRVVAAVGVASVLDEYEQAFRTAGYAPGVVLPSMLALLGGVDATEPTLIAKVDAHTTSVAILQNDKLMLFRTVENNRGKPLDGEALADEVYPSVVFFQDTYHMNIAKIYVSGLSNAAEAIAALHSQTGIEAHELVDQTRLSSMGSAAGSVAKSQRWRLAGVMGALGA
jgi:type IV pilus assembly protein PilM